MVQYWHSESENNRNHVHNWVMPIPNITFSLANGHSVTFPVLMGNKPLNHDGVTKWKHFPRYWPFVRRNHRSPVNSPHKGQWRGALILSFICAWIHAWVKKSWVWWFETPSRSLWRHLNDVGELSIINSCPIFLATDIWIFWHISIFNWAYFIYNTSLKNM